MGCLTRQLPTHKTINDTTRKDATTHIKKIHLNIISSPSWSRGPAPNAATIDSLSRSWVLLTNGSRVINISEEHVIFKFCSAVTVPSSLKSPLLTWLTTISLIFEGRRSNFIALEQLTLQHPNSGSVLTFLRFLLIFLYGLPRFLIWTSCSPRF